MTNKTSIDTSKKKKSLIKNNNNFLHSPMKKINIFSDDIKNTVHELFAFAYYINDKNKEKMTIEYIAGIYEYIILN